MRSDDERERQRMLQVREILSRGTSLSEEEVVALEAVVAAQPDFGDGRWELVGYYASKCENLEIAGPMAIAAAARRLPLKTITDHLLWLAENEPDNFAFTWIDGLITVLEESQRLAILEVFAQAWEKDRRKLSILRTLASVGNRYVPEQIVSLFDKIDFTEPLGLSESDIQGILLCRYEIFESLVRKGKASFSQDDYTARTIRDDGAEPWARALGNYGLAKENYDKGNLVEARHFGQSLLMELNKVEKNPSPLLMHKMHTLMGLIALENGEIESAKFHLEASCAPPFDNPLRCFGPYIDLAKALFDRGYVQEVEVFFVKCGKLCAPHKKDELDTFAKAVRKKRGSSEWLAYPHLSTITWAK